MEGYKEKAKEIMVIGHKNPDTDSICSAICYADLKNKITGTDNYVPKRAGHLNEDRDKAHRGNKQRNFGA